MFVSQLHCQILESKAKPDTCWDVWLLSFGCCLAIQPTLSPILTVLVFSFEDPLFPNSNSGGLSRASFLVLQVEKVTRPRTISAYHTDLIKVNPTQYFCRDYQIRDACLSLNMKLKNAVLGATVSHPVTVKKRLPKTGATSGEAQPCSKGQERDPYLYGQLHFTNAWSQFSRDISKHGSEIIG